MGYIHFPIFIVSLNSADMNTGKEPEAILMELLFQRHIKNVSDRIGESNARRYAKAIDGRLRSVLWINFASLLILVIMVIGLVRLKEETLSNFLLLGILMLVYSIFHLLGIRNVDKETGYDPELTVKWRSISIYTSLSGISCSLLSIFMMFSGFDISFGKEQAEERHEAYNVRYEELGININIPEGWSQPQWEYKSDSSDKRPQYRFRTYDPDRTMWFYVYGRSTPPRYNISDFITDWQRSIPSYLDDQIIEEVAEVELNGMRALRTVGKRKDYPDFIYVCYRVLHSCSMIHYTYSFRKNLPYEEELASSAKIFRMIQFTDVEVPVYSARTDSRPSDWIHSDGYLDIKSAGIRIAIPDEEDIIWKKNSRSEYIFSTPLGAYDLKINLRVVYTSESADISEFVESFTSSMDALMDAGYEESPDIIKIGKVKALRATGKSSNGSGSTIVRYDLIYKGARLQIDAEVPSPLNQKDEVRKIDEAVSRIVFY